MLITFEHLQKGSMEDLKRKVDHTLKEFEHRRQKKRKRIQMTFPKDSLSLRAYQKIKQ